MRDTTYARRCCGIAGDAMPDHATIHRFDDFMSDVDLVNDLLNESAAYLRDAGVADDSARLLDSIVHLASGSTKNKAGKRGEDMRVGRKGQVYYFGGKSHALTDGGGCA